MFARKFWKSLVTMAARPSRALESHVTGSGLVAGPGLAMFAAGGLSIRMEREVTECDRKKFKKVFESCDEQNKGYLSREDLKVAVVMLFGYKPSKVEIDSMMLSVHSNSAGVTFDDFLIMTSTKKAAQLSFGEQRQIFSAFDVHCRGFLTLEDFKRAFKYVAQRLPEQTVLEAFREVDQDSDGLICYKDFEFVMNYGEDEE